MLRVRGRRSSENGERVARCGRTDEKVRCYLGKKANGGREEGGQACQMTAMNVISPRRYLCSPVNVNPDRLATFPRHSCTLHSNQARRENHGLLIAHEPCHVKMVGYMLYNCSPEHFHHAKSNSQVLSSAQTRSGRLRAAAIRRTDGRTELSYEKTKRRYEVTSERTKRS